MLAAYDRQSATKVVRSGTHRVCNPEETLKRALRIAPVTGITRIGNVTGLDTIGIPVVMVCRPNARSLAVSQGKGLTLLAAKASGIMESVEQYHAETITLPLRLGSYEELRYAHTVVDVAELPAIRTSVFHPSFRLLWCEGRDLASDEQILVPFELVHTDYRWPLPTGSGCFAATSNGLASGNHVLEAISHGICEVVERDSTALWSFKSQSGRDQTRVDLDSVDDRDCRAVLQRFDDARVAVAAWETTSDIGLASFKCVIAPREQDQLRYIPAAVGMGCHPSRAVALLRALTEAAQSRLTQIAGSRDDAPKELYVHYRGGAVDRFLEREMASRPVRSFMSAPDRDGETLIDDVEYEIDLLRKAGMERVIVVDLTRPEFDIPVARVVIPGLEGAHFAPGYVPGRRARAVAAAKA